MTDQRDGNIYISEEGISLAVNLAVANIHPQNLPDVNGRIQPKMWRGHRVVTYKDISAVHSVPVDQVRKAFFRHRKDMIQGTDYFGLRGREVRDFKAEAETLESHRRGGANMLNVFTESGYIKLAQTFRNSKKIRNMLVNSYFQLRQAAGAMTAAPVMQEKPSDAIAALETTIAAQTNELRRLTETLQQIAQSSAAANERNAAVFEQLTRALTSIGESHDKTSNMLLKEHVGIVSVLEGALSSDEATSPKEQPQPILDTKKREGEWTMAYLASRFVWYSTAGLPHTGYAAAVCRACNIWTHRSKNYEDEYSRCVVTDTERAWYLKPAGIERVRAWCKQNDYGKKFYCPERYSRATGTFKPGDIRKNYYAVEIPRTERFCHRILRFELKYAD